jgi:hypothetical protein
MLRRVGRRCGVSTLAALLKKSEYTSEEGSFFTEKSLLVLDVFL